MTAQNLKLFGQKKQAKRIGCWYKSNPNWICWTNKKKIDGINADREQTKFVLTILELNFVGVNIMFFLVYSNQDSNTKRFKSQR